MAEINQPPVITRSRRLTVEQVRALEKAFEMDNKLESERKVQLAKQLALQERQVAVWFQNRRARWKTKQLEKDHRILSKKLEFLKADRDRLIKEKEKLESEVMRLKSDKTRAMLPSVGQLSCATNATPTHLSAEMDKEGSSVTSGNAGKAIDKEASPSTSQSRFVDLVTQANSIRFEDMVMQSETIDLLDFTNLYCGGMISTQQT